MNLQPQARADTPGGRPSAPHQPSLARRRFPTASGLRARARRLSTNRPTPWSSNRRQSTRHASRAHPPTQRDDPGTSPTSLTTAFGSNPWALPPPRPSQPWQSQAGRRILSVRAFPSRRTTPAPRATPGRSRTSLTTAIRSNPWAVPPPRLSQLCQSQAGKSRLSAHPAPAPTLPSPLRRMGSGPSPTRL